MRRRRKRTEAQASIRTGTLTILLLVTTVILAVIAVLALQTSRQNARHAELYASTMSSYYENDAAGQELLAQIDAVVAKGGTRAQLQAALPAECAVDDETVSVAFVEGAPCAVERINTATEFENGGIATSGLSSTDAVGTPALTVKVSYSGKGYTVEAWNHVLTYDMS